MTEKKPTAGRVCPECRSDKVVPIRYGYPLEEAREAANRGEIALGGCLVDDENPNWLWKHVESLTGKRPHKVASPIAAVALPALLANWLAPETLRQICGFVAQVCEKPETLAVLPGIVAWLAHALGSGVDKSGGK